MKKMININFQGRIIPIEETSFDILKSYIDSLRVHFSNEEGRDEIINDIESRIAELFAERLQHTACITDGDVLKVIASMGRPEDFEEAEATGNYTASSASTQYAEANAISSEPKKWRRSKNDKILGGVCAGIAHYLKIDPAIVRILVAILAFGSFGFCLILYIVMWIILPAEDLQPNSPRRLYRSPENKMLGGVAAGLAAYFNKEEWVPRLSFLAPILLSIFFGIVDVDGLRGLFGGLFAAGFVLYVILWIILPEARSTSARLEMKGEKVNLQSIKNSVKDENLILPPATPGRLGRLIGILFKAFFLCIAAAISFILISMLVFLLIGNSFNGMNISSATMYVFDNPLYEPLLWGSILLVFGIPAIALLTWTIRRIMGTRSRRPYLAYVFSSLWIIGLAGLIFLLIATARNFRSRNIIEEETVLVAPSSGKLMVSGVEQFSNFKYKWRKFNGMRLLGDANDSLLLNNVQILISPSKDSLYYFRKVRYASGLNEPSARQAAENIQYTIQQHDSSLLVPKGFIITQNQKFRNQQVLVVLEIPVGKRIEMGEQVKSTKFATIFDDRGWYEDFPSHTNWRSNQEYIMTLKGLIKVEKQLDKKEESKERH